MGRPTMKSVLFACNLNSVRSPIAAAIARHYFGRRLTVDSAGVEAGELDGFAIATMVELGIDIAKHRPKTFDQLSEDGALFDLIITLSPEAHHRALEFARGGNAEVEYWPTQDPTLAIELGLSREGILSSYRRVRDSLSERILSRLGMGPLGNL